MNIPPIRPTQVFPTAVRPTLVRPTRRMALGWAAALAAPSAFVPRSSLHAQVIENDHPISADAGVVSHGLAMHGGPALPPDFAHLPYANPQAPKGGRLNVAFSGTFDSLNPFNLKSGSAAQGLNGNVFQSLMARSLDEPFTLYGLIAQTIETNAARDYVVFRLNRDARFSDGAPITSEDVLFTFHLLSEQGRPQHRSAFSLVKHIEARDAHTVYYDLSGADDRELPMILALMPVLPKHRVNMARFAESSLEPPIGAGPYTIESVKPGERLVLRRNRDYWARDLPIMRGMANFDEIHISYYRDANSMFESFKTGLLDYREEGNPTRWNTGYDFPAVRKGLVVREQLPIAAPRGTEGFAFNTRRPLFNDARVREALAIMFDFEWINRNFYANLYTRTTSFFDNSDLSAIGKPAGPAERELLAPFPGVVREDIMEGRWRPFRTDGSGRDRNQAQVALDLMKAAGWRLEAGALTKNGEKFSFEFMVVDRTQERLALMFANSLARIGVQARVRNVDEVQYQRRRQKFDFDVMLGTWTTSASPGNEQRNRWGAASASQESSFNLTGAQAPALDALIHKMLSARTRPEFADAVRAYDRVLLSGFYITPLFHANVQWCAHWKRIARPQTLPRWAAPLFSSTLDSWWSVET